MTSERIDIRTQIALDILKKKGVFKVLKTTRAGATNSLCSACLENNYKFLILVPTNRIADETIVKDVKTIAQKEDSVIIHVPSNFKCYFNEELIQEKPEYGLFRSLPIIGKCEECKRYNKCPVTEILRVEDFNGIVMTYDKLIALQLTSQLYPESKAAIIMGKLQDIRTIIYDEAHNLAFDRITSFEFPEINDNIRTLKNKIKEINKTYKDESRIERNRFKITETIISRFYKLLNNPEIKEIRTKLIDDYVNNNETWYKRKHSVSVKNPVCKSIITNKNIKNKCSNKSEITIIDIDNVYGELTNEIMDLFDFCEKHQLTEYTLITIFDMLDFVISRNINIEINKKFDKKGINKSTVYINLSTVNSKFNEAITEFSQFMQTEYRQIILTSATFPDFNYNKYFFPTTKINNIMFGKDGDPLNTNSKLTIFCDTKKYHAGGDNSIKKNEGLIIESCTNIMDIYGSENCLIICRNKFDYERFKNIFENTDYNPYITYYRSPDMMGVKSKKRVGILIGLAHIPSDSFDSIRDTVMESRILVEERMHCDTYQALSRVKDPEGIEPSVVFALGSTIWDVQNVVLWGGDRKLNIIETENGKATEKNVIITGEKVSTPSICEIKNWHETLVMSMIHMFGLAKTKGLASYGCSNLSKLHKDEFIVNSKLELLQSIFEETKYKTQYKYENRHYSDKDIPINNDIICEHLEGNKNYYFRPVLSKKTNTISFETDSKINLNKLKLFLDTNNTPYVIEKLNNYRIWIFIKEDIVSIAKKIVYLIIDEVGNNYKVNLSNELIKLPFGKDSEILIDGQFVNDFINLKIGILDLSTFDTLPKKLNLPSPNSPNIENNNDVTRYCA